MIVGSLVGFRFVNVIVTVLPSTETSECAPLTSKGMHSEGIRNKNKRPPACSMLDEAGQRSMIAAIDRSIPSYASGIRCWAAFQDACGMPIDPEADTARTEARGPSPPCTIELKPASAILVANVWNCIAVAKLVSREYSTSACETTHPVCSLGGRVKARAIHQEAPAFDGGVPADATASRHVSARRSASPQCWPERTSLCNWSKTPARH